MTTSSRAALLALVIAALVKPAFANDVSSSDGDISAEKLWSVETPVGGADGAVYLRLNNKGVNDDRLLFAYTKIANKVQFYDASKHGDGEAPREISSIIIKGEEGGHAHIDLSPHESYIKLLGLRKPLTSGDSIPLTLFFLNADRQEILVPVYTAAAAAQLGGADTHHGDAHGGGHGGEHGDAHGGEHGDAHGGGDHGDAHGGEHGDAHGGSEHGGEHAGADHGATDHGATDHGSGATSADTGTGPSGHGEPSAPGEVPSAGHGSAPQTGIHNPEGEE